VELTYNNYLYGTGSGPTWVVNIDPATREPLSYYEETRRAAEMVWSEKLGDRVTLLYSGGMDSEYVLNVFRSLKMKIEPVIMKLDPGYNDKDFYTAVSYCTKNNISYKTVRLNFDQFVESGKAMEFAKRNKVSKYQMTATMWLATQVDTTVITGNDPPLIRNNTTQQPYGRLLEELQYIHSQFNNWREYTIHGTPFFLSYTPEMMLAFLEHPVIQKFVYSPHDMRDTDKVKVGVYNDQQDFIIEPRVKLTGYEEIHRSKIARHPDLVEINEGIGKQWDGVSFFVYNDIIKHLRSNLS